MGVEISTTIDIYYRLTNAYDYLNCDEKTKKLLDTLHGCIKHIRFDSLSIKKEDAVDWRSHCNNPSVCTLSFTFDNRNERAAVYSKKKLDEDFNGDFKKSLECVVARYDFVFDYLKKYRDVYSYSGETVFSEEDEILALSHEDGIEESVSEQGYFYDSKDNLWHSNPNFGNTSILPYVAKELFAVEIVENDLNPGKLQFKEDWNPANIKNPASIKNDHLKEEWKKAAQELH